MENDIDKWRLQAYGNVIRGDEDTSEDQIGEGCNAEVAERLAACWNLCLGISTHDLVYGKIKIVNGQITDAY